MATLLAFDNILEFLLRYTVITGVVIAMLGLTLCLIAKRLTMAVRKQDEINPKDKLYVTLRIIGICMILVGMIVMVLPIEATFYHAA